MYYVRHEGDFADVRFVHNDDEYHADGHVVLKADDVLFDTPVAELEDGIYDNDGVFVGPLTTRPSGKPIRGH